MDVYNLLEVKYHCLTQEKVITAWHTFGASGGTYWSDLSQA